MPGQTYEIKQLGRYAIFYGINTVVSLHYTLIYRYADDQNTNSISNSLPNILNYTRSINNLDIDFFLFYSKSIVV